MGRSSGGDGRYPATLAGLKNRQMFVKVSHKQVTGLPTLLPKLAPKRVPCPHGSPHLGRVRLPLAARPPARPGQVLQVRELDAVEGVRGAWLGLGLELGLGLGLSLGSGVRVRVGARVRVRVKLRVRVRVIKASAAPGVTRRESVGRFMLGLADPNPSPNPNPNPGPNPNPA